MTRTQIRLDQVTGSFGDFEGGIVDSKATASSLAAIPEVSGSLVDALSHMASAIKRIHGGSAFTTQAAGVFAGRIQVDDTTNATSTTDGSLQTDGGLSVALDAVIGDDLFLKSDSAVLNLGADSDVTLTHDGSTGGTLAASAGKVDITAGAASTFSTTAGNLTVDSNAGNLVLDGHTGVDIDASNSGKVSIDGAGGIDIGVAADVAIDIDSSTLDIDASGNITIDASAGSISIGTNSSGRAINIGHTTSEVTINDNLTVTGDLTVNGATTTLDTTNLLVEDVVIGMAANALSQNQNGGLAIFSGSTDSDLVLGRADNDVWGFGKKATLKGTVTNLSDMTFVAARASGFQVGSVNNRIDLAGVSGADLRIVSSADLKLDAGGGQVYITGSLVPGAGATYSIGDAATSFLNLYVSNPYIGGVSRYDGPSNQVLVKSGSGGLLLKNSVEFADGQSGAAAANGFIAFQDALLTGSSPSWAAFNGTVPLASAKSEWDSFQTNFGQVSLISAINAAKTGTPGSGKATAVRSGGTLAAGSIFTLSGFSHQDVADASRTSQVDVFVNGQLLLSGALNANDYTLDSLANNQIKFSFDLENDDVVTGIIR